jgi:hypothetical protein
MGKDNEMTGEPHKQSGKMSPAKTHLGDANENGAGQILRCFLYSSA